LIREVLKETKPVRFEGNNYSDEWKAEAKRRGLPTLDTTPAAVQVLEDERAWQFLVDQGVLNAEEVRARYNISLERYIKEIDMEAATLLELTDTHVLPAVETELRGLAAAAVNAKTAGYRFLTGGSWDDGAVRTTPRHGDALARDHARRRNSTRRSGGRTRGRERAAGHGGPPRRFGRGGRAGGRRTLDTAKYREILFLR